MTRSVGRVPACRRASVWNIAKSAATGSRKPAREALPGVRLCVHCQEEADREQQAVSLYNRKGSKDSQLR